MSLPESIIMLLVVGSILLGGGLYYALTRKPVKKPLMLQQVRELPPDDDFELSTALFPERPTENIPEPPGRYEQTRFTALIRDPYWIYSYWDIAATHQNALREQYGLAEPNDYIIRVHDITEERKKTALYDLPVNIQAREWYIHVGMPNRMFMLELGALVNGNFILIARSNQVKTPRDSLSEKIDPDWMLVDDLQCKLYGQIGLSGPSSPGQWQQPSSHELIKQ